MTNDFAGNDLAGELAWAARQLYNHAHSSGHRERMQALARRLRAGSPPVAPATTLIDHDEDAVFVVAERLRAFVRKHLAGGCRIMSLGPACVCPLCDADRLIAVASAVAPARPTQDAAIEALREAIYLIRCGPKASIGEWENTYTPQIDVRRVERWDVAYQAALVAIDARSQAGNPRETTRLPEHDIELLERLYDYIAGKPNLWTAADRNTLGGILEYVRGASASEPTPVTNDEVAAAICSYNNWGPSMLRSAQTHVKYADVRAVALRHVLEDFVKGRSAPAGRGTDSVRTPPERKGDA